MQQIEIFCKYLKTMFLPSDARSDKVLALVVVSISNKILTHIFHLTASESRTVVETPIQNACLPSQQLNQLPNLQQLRQQIYLSTHSF